MNENVTNETDNLDETPAEQPEAAQAEPDTFPAEYVRQLRKEAADSRAKAKRADDLEQALFVERVRATGRLADPADMPFAAGLIDDPSKLSEALDTLLASKPHLAARRFESFGGQGTVGKASAGVSLMDMLRGA